jgi:predicted Fe-Mo cluster-binding NifX family protein
MKIAISAINCQMDKPLAPLFYKCRMFCIFDTESNRADFFENPWYEKALDSVEEMVCWLNGKNVKETLSVKYRDEMENCLLHNGIVPKYQEKPDTTMEEVIEGLLKNTLEY